MKRKLALLLAGVMTLSLVPMNLFASSANSLSGTVTVGKKTLVVEEGVVSKANLSSNVAATIYNNNDAEYIIEGPYLLIRPNHDVKKNTSFRLELTNAKWFMDPDDSDRWTKGRVDEDVSTASTPKQMFGTQYNTAYGDVTGGTSYDRYASTKFTSASGLVLPYYSLNVSGADATRATITFEEDIPAYESSAGRASQTWDSNESYPGYIVIPLLTRTDTTSEDIKVSITDIGSTNISSGTFVFGSVSDTLTQTYVDDPETARDDIPMNMIVIKEQRVGSMEDGTIQIVAPSGFEFNSDTVKRLQIYAEGFGSSSEQELIAKGIAKANWYLTRSEDDYSILEITFTGLPRSSNMRGAMYIKLSPTGSDNDTDIYLTADEDAAFGDIMMRIRNKSGDTVVSNETFLGGTRRDWTMNFKTDGTIPTLVNGRYDDDDAMDSQDDDHLAATVIFEELVENAWAAGRVTEFELPKEVKIRKLDIVDTDSTLKTEIEGAGYYDGYYMNTGKRDGKVLVDENKFNFSGITIESKEKGYVEMEMWLSVASGYEGDITLTATGSAVSDDLEPIVIAKAVNPVDITTTVSDVQIGHQYFGVADIEITENAAGYLEKNKEIWVTVSDLIYQDMYFTPGYSVEVTDGNLKLKDIGLGTGTSISVTNGKIKYSDDKIGLGSGTIRLDVDGASSTASTIRLSNLQLKIDRTVPESSDSHYSVFVWGPNVAPNSDVFDYSANTVSAYEGNDQHNVVGLAAPYVRVVTSADGNTSVLSSIVKITVGSTTGYVNGESITVDPAPFIDSGTSRMMVPLRAVSTLLGVSDNRISWSDAARTATINMPDRIVQFTIGSPVMTVNGTQMTMDTTAVIVNERTFIPFRYLGDGLGVEVAYDDSTKTATYNPNKQ